MICPYCKMEDIPEDAIYCVHCSHPLCIIELPEWIYTERNDARRATVNLDLSNQSNSQLEIFSFAFDSQNIELNVSLPANAKETQQIPLTFTDDITKLKKDVEVRIEGRFGDKEITAFCEVTLCPYPEIDFEETDELSVGPTKGYHVKVPVELKNESLVELSHLQWEIRKLDGDFVTDGEQKLQNPLSLPENGNYRGEITFPLPPSRLQNRNEYNLSVRILSLEGLPPKVFKLKCLDLPDISLIPTRWTQEGRKVDDSTPDNPSWNVAIDTERKKDFTIRVKIPEPDAEEWYDGVKIHQVGFELGPQRLSAEVPQEPMAPNFDYSANLIVQINHNYQGKMIFDLVDWRADPPIVSKEFQLSLTAIKKSEYPDPFHLGMDFGTANSTIALILPDENKEIDTAFGEVLSIPVERYSEDFDARIMPSVVSFGDNLTHQAIGRDVPDVSSLSVSERKFIIKSVKRNLIEDRGCFINEEDIKEKAATFIMTELLRRAVEYLEEQGYAYSFPNICLPVPTMADQIEVDRLVACCENALRELGIQEPKIQTVDESYAALLYFFKYQMPNPDFSDGDKILMYDFGGGTTDLTLIQFNEQEPMYEVLEVGGDTTLGGDDVTRKIGEITGKDEYPAEMIKLSMDSEHNYGDYWLATEQKIERQVLIKEIREYLRPRVANILQDIGIQLGKPNDNLKLVVLAGGSSRLEGFEALIRELLPEVEVERLNEPKLSVAMGAFMYPYQAIRLLRLTRIPFRVLLALPTAGVKPAEYISFVSIENINFAILIEKGKKYGEDGTITKEYNLTDLRISPRAGIPLSFYFQYGVGRPRLRFFHRIENPNATKITIMLDKNKKIQIKEK